MNGSAVAIAGCGRMGAQRARHVIACGGRIAAFVDPDRERARALAELHPQTPPATVCADAADLPWSRLAGVFVCTPPADHAAVVDRAARAGVAVFVEKPLGSDLASARAVVESVERAGILGAVGYMNRYRGGVAYARELLARRPGLLGISAHWAGGRYRVPWWSDRELSGGPANEQATHLVDLCRYLGGEIVRTHAVATDGDERLGTVLELASGALATILYTCEADRKTIGVDVLHRDGGLRLEGWDFALARDTIAGALAAPDPVDPFGTEVRAFLHALATGDAAELRCGVADAYRTQLALAAILASASRCAAEAV